MRKLALLYFNLPLILRYLLLALTFPAALLFINKLTKTMGGIDKAIEKYNGLYKDRTDILTSIILFAATPDEYYLYGFNKLKFSVRDTFLTDRYRILLLKTIGEGKALFDALSNKFDFYKLNSEYFKREAILFNEATTLDVFKEFCLIHKRVFIKENAGSFGYNARLLDVSNVNLQVAFNELKSQRTDFILEVAIQQDPMMAQWNSSSVNTVRVPTFLNNKGFFVIEPFLRTGRDGAVVDNAGAGGVFAVIDPKTGVIITDGVDELGNLYPSHPNTQLQYRGYSIPKWDELLEICENAHRLMPHHIYIAYDFALTKDGWVMVEGNWGQFVSQIATKYGSKANFLELVK